VGPATLRCEGLVLTRGQRRVLDGVDASFLPGEVTLIAGPTGSGKSTLLHLLGGLLRPTEGTVFAGDEPVSRWTAGHRDRWRRDVGIALQDPHLLPGLSALENVILPLVPRGATLAELRAAGRGALEAVGAGDLAGSGSGALSGGERQRVGLARALVSRPGYVLVDEPTAHQDPGGVALVVAALEAARARGAVVVASAHDPRLLEAGLGGSLLRLTDGRLEPCSTP
jgi:putative ABC transport system ATP-binding protein